MNLLELKNKLLESVAASITMANEIEKLINGDGHDAVGVLFEIVQ